MIKSEKSEQNSFAENCKAIFIERIHNMKRSQLISLILAGSALFFLLLFLPLGQSENLYDSVIRIHVLANSDSQEDQARKLAVRDEILNYTRNQLSLGKNREEAKAVLEMNLGRLEQVAKKTLEANGSHHEVNVIIGEEYYPTREYETLSLPAGTYLSLQVQIGEAKGKNWWCVLFPPLCLSSSVEAEDALAGAGMTEENVATVTGEEPTYRIRFKLLELFQKTKKSVKELF